MIRCAPRAPRTPRTPRPAGAAAPGRAALAVLVALAAAGGCGGSGGDSGAGAAGGSRQASPSGGPTSTAAPGTAASPPGASPGAAPAGGAVDPARVDHRDATAVSRAAVLTMWSVDSATDGAQRDAYRRARPFLTPEYYTAIAGETSGKLSNEWLRHRAYAKVRVAPQQVDSGAGTDTSTSARRQWGITVIPTGRDGWRGGKVRAVAFVNLTRPDASAPWRVSAVTTG
ncbi:hypothetical protein [Spirillospora sp. NPDC029432]|uniref:hypothetical protein n=1 Tax=Spirillospora sp. NPDC029432 TaxID=3154599 RepID=UPI003454C54E